VDQFTLADQFMTFFREEHAARGGCPADWVWVVSPASASLTPTFHQEMINYAVRPAFVYQVRSACVGWVAFRLSALLYVSNNVEERAELLGFY